MGNHTRIFVGHSDDCDEEDAVNEVVSQIEESLGEAPAVALVHMSGTYDSEDVAKRFQNTWPNTPVIGVTCSGISSNGRDCLEDSLAMMALRSDNLRGSVGFSREFNQDSGPATLAALEEALAKGPNECPTAIYVFPSGAHGDITRMFEVVSERLGTHVPILGALAGDTFTEGFTGHCFGNGQAAIGAISLMCLWGDLELQWGVCFGQQTIGDTMVVTEMDGPRVVRLDGLPAYQRLSQIYDGFGQGDDTAWGFSLGILKDDGDVDYIRAAHPPPDGETPDYITIATSLPVGSRLKLQIGGFDGFLESAEIATDAAISNWKHSHPPAGYIVTSCAARRWTMGTDFVKEIQCISEKLSQAFGELPCIGGYAFGEIAPVDTYNRFHNETCVITLVG